MPGRAARAVRIIGPGRAGRSLSAALQKAGWRDAGALGRGDDLRDAARGVDLLLVTTPDSVIADVAAAVDPVPTTLVAHAAGSLGPDVLLPHDRRAALHPLRSLPTPSTDIAGAWFAVSGDAAVTEVVAELGGHSVRLADDASARAAYHAAAVVASNHLVALLAQVERLAAKAGMPLDAFLDLVRGTIDNVELMGPRAALTGPVARGDWETVRRHVDAIGEDERDSYVAMVREAARLAGRASPC